jgi:hypothetical protein
MENIILEWNYTLIFFSALLRQIRNTRRQRISESGAGGSRNCTPDFCGSKMVHLKLEFNCNFTHSTTQPHSKIIILG